MEVLSVVVPGDQVLEFNPRGNSERITIGPGLRCQENAIVATRSGLLKRTGKNLYYVDSHQKRYVPQKGEFVIGIIVKKKGDNYLIDIGGSEKAVISSLAFENTSKKNRKKLKLGDLVYGQLNVASKDEEPELVCIDFDSKSVGLGALPEDGIYFTQPLHVVRMISDPSNSFLKTIAQRISYTIVVGLNGRVWLMAPRQRDMVAIMNCLMMLEVMPMEEAKKKLFSLLDSFAVKQQTVCDSDWW